MASASMDAWSAKVVASHTKEVEAGLHDRQCEWRANGFYMCHCSKRRREAEGFTEPPGPLIYRYPLCPRCTQEVHHDGDTMCCYTCHVAWPPNTDGDGYFTDDYGELDPSPWDARLKAE